MEEIKTNIEKIFEQFTETATYGVSKRLSFNNLNESIGLNSSIKRKYSLDEDDSEKNVEKKKKNDLNSNQSNDSLNVSVIASPWEGRRIKADLIEAKSMITHLKLELDHQHTSMQNTKLKYTNKVNSLQKQAEHSALKIQDLEKHITILRRRENHAKEELMKTKNTLNTQKLTFDETIQALEKSNAGLRDELSMVKNDSTNEINALNRHIQNIEQILETSKNEVEVLQEIKDNLQIKADKHDEISKQIEIEKQKLNSAEMKIKDLEYELANYGEWKSLSKLSQSKLTSMPEIEKEICRLRQENKNLRDTIGNKLLLEEEVYDLKTRLEKYEKNNIDVIQLKVKITNLEQELNDWKAIGEDHCPQNTIINPMSVRAYIQQILQKDVITTSEKNSAFSEKNVFKTQLQELNTQNKIFTKANNDLRDALKHNQNILHRVQKKLLLVARERDCYKQLIENYEKDLTISVPTSGNSTESQMRIRLDMLEKNVNEYKEMCSNLEKDLQNAKYISPDLIGVESTVSNKHYERLKKELDSLRIENETIKRRNDELELELEHRSLKGDFNNEKFKVVHLELNPAATAYDAHKNEIEKLQAEIERLRRKNRKLEEEHGELTSKLNTSNVTMQVREMNTLRQQLASYEAKNQHIRDLYKAANLEFREICYLLFGYRVDRMGNANFRISSLFAESEEEYLNFRLNESGVLDMLQTNYSVSLTDMMQKHLVSRNSLPAFLSTLTLELFNKTTTVVNTTRI